MELTRRNFVKAAGSVAGAAVALGTASGALADEAAETEPSDPSDEAATSETAGDAASSYSGTDYVDAAAEGKQPTIIDYTNVIEEVGEPTSTEDHDLIVVGAGGTGLAAGIQAFEDGLDVVVLEKKGLAGGTFPGSEGMFAVGSHWQEEAGISIDVEEIVNRLMTYY